MKIGAIIQARMGSTRLAGKVLKEIKGKSVLQHVIERVQQSKMIDEIVIATTVHERDSIIETEALKYGVKLFRGDEDNVLSRYYHAAKENEIDIVIRITSDCPLIDPYVIDDIINKYLNGKYEIVTNAGSDLSQRTFPRGLDVEVFSFDILANAYNNARKTHQLEHVTPYMYENSKRVFFYKNDTDYSKYRWTLDTAEDFKLISEVYNHLYNGVHNFKLNDIIELFKRKPDLYLINAHIEQKKLK